MTATPEAVAIPAGTFVAVVTSYRGVRLKVYAEPETAEELAGFRFWKVYGGLNDKIPTGANLKLWPLDLVKPLRSALAEGRSIDLRRFRSEERQRKQEEREDKKAGRVVAADEAEDLARELGLL